MLDYTIFCVKIRIFQIIEYCSTIVPYFEGLLAHSYPNDELWNDTKYYRKILIWKTKNLLAHKYVK